MERTVTFSFVILEHSVLIGECRLPLNMFQHGSVVDQWFPLNNGSKRAGEINLRIQLCDSSASGKASKISSGQSYPVAQPVYPSHVPGAMATAAAAAAAPAYNQPHPSKKETNFHCHQNKRTYCVFCLVATTDPNVYAQQQQQQWHIQQQQQQIAQQQQQIAHQQAHMARMAATPTYVAPPPPPMVMAPPPPAVVMAPPPVVYGQPVMYGPGYGHHYHRHHRYHDGADGGNIAMGVGAGLLGGMLLGEMLDDGLFD